MLGKFLLKRYFFYQAMGWFRLWGVYIFFLKFARWGGMFAGWLCAVSFGLLGAGVLLSLGPLFGPIYISAPTWIYIIVISPLIIITYWIWLIGLELFWWGFRAPKQFIIGNLFWSEANERRYVAYLKWLEEQKHDSKTKNT